MATKFPKVSVVVSNYNGITLELLTDCLSSILSNNYPNFEVLLVDNASTDNSVSVATKMFGKNPLFKLIKNPVNMYSQGLNLGVKNSTGEYVAFFNNDTFVKNGYFQQFVPFLEKNPNVALAQSLLVSYYNHEIVDSAGETMDPYGNPITIGAGESINNKKYTKVYEVLSVSGSCSILRKSVVEKIGYFDNDYGIGYEDLDLSLRAWMNNYKVLYYPEVIAYHKRGATDLSPIVRIKARWHFNKNRIATMLKNFPWIFVIKRLPGTILIYIAAGLWEIIVKQKFKLGISRFTSIIWVIGNLPQILRKRSVVQSMSSKKSLEKIESLLDKRGLTQSIQSFIGVK
jgi:GT2 family glycosyltransferase